MSMSMSMDPIIPPPLPPSLLQAAGGPLTGEHLTQLSQAEARARKIRKAAGVAMFNGCTIGGIAGLSLFISLIGSVMEQSIDFTGLIISTGLGLVAWNEFKGRRMLRQFDLRGPRLLGWNQVCLMVLVIGYCVWTIVIGYIRPNPELNQALDQLKAMNQGGALPDLLKMLSVIIYGSVIVATGIFQGLNALYYFSRAGILHAYLNETPPWIVEVQRRSTAG
jgi:hypothetical protein